LAQRFEILILPSPHSTYTLVLTCAATALRSSEILALRWSDE
jgi:integrase